jgi:hypothetical protein
VQQRTNSCLAPQSTEHASLLPQYAFVVQLRAGADVQQGRIQGRVEHIQSGQSIPFDSLDQLLQFMAQMLAA